MLVFYKMKTNNKHSTQGEQMTTEIEVDGKKYTYCKKCDIFYDSCLVKEAKKNSDKSFEELGFRIFDLTCPMCNLRSTMNLTTLLARRRLTSFGRRKTPLSRRDRKPVISLKKKK